MTDNVNHPSHYTQGGVECIDAITAATVNKTGIEAVCTGNVIKYLWRYEAKNGLEDVKKAQWYINRLIAELEGKAAVAKSCPHEWVAYGMSKDKGTGVLAPLCRCRLCGLRSRTGVTEQLPPHTVAGIKADGVEEFVSNTVHKIFDESGAVSALAYLSLANSHVKQLREGVNK